MSLISELLKGLKSVDCEVSVRIGKSVSMNPSLELPDEENMASDQVNNVIGIVTLVEKVLPLFLSTIAALKAEFKREPKGPAEGANNG